MGYCELELRPQTGVLVELCLARLSEAQVVQLLSGHTKRSGIEAEILGC